MSLYCNTLDQVKDGVDDPVLCLLSASAGLRTMDRMWCLGMAGWWLTSANSASGPVNVESDHSAPRGSVRCWMGAVAVKAVPCRSESSATRGTSVTRTRACTATSPRTNPNTRSECAPVSIWQNITIINNTVCGLSQILPEMALTAPQSVLCR